MSARDKQRDHAFQGTPLRFILSTKDGQVFTHDPSTRPVPVRRATRLLDQLNIPDRDVRVTCRLSWLLEFIEDAADGGTFDLVIRQAPDED